MPVKANWSDGDFIMTHEFRRAFGFLADTDPARLVLTDLKVDGEQPVTFIEVALLRTEDNISVVVPPGGGSCTLEIPAGVERPPFVRVRAMNEIDRTVHEGDVRLPVAPSGELRGARLVGGDEPATLSLKYEINEATGDSTQIDWRFVWSCLPTDWEENDRLDKDEFEQWMGTLRKELSSDAFARVERAIHAKLDPLRMSAHSSTQSSKAASPNPSPMGSRSGSRRNSPAALAGAVVAALAVGKKVMK